MIGVTGSSLQLQSIMTDRNEWLSKTRFIPYWTTGIFSSTVTNDDQKIPAHTLNSLTSLSYITTDSQSVGLSCLWGLTTRFLLLSGSFGFLMWDTLSDERTVCRLQLLLALASAVILGSESRGTRDHILISQIGDFPFRRLL
jgi:hypothetical protein